MPVPDMSDAGRQIAKGLMAAILSLCASGAAMADPPMGVWEGSATCSDGEHFYRISIEPGDGVQRFVLDVLDAPGGLWSARSIGQVNPNPNDPTVFQGGHGNEWVLRPFVEPRAPYSSREYTISADGQMIASEPFGGDAFHDECEGAEFNRLPAAAATGGIETAMDLPGRFVGQIGCSGFRPAYAIELALTGIGERDVEGVLTFSQHPDGTPTDGGVFAVFGTFEPRDGTLTLIGDRWIEQRYSGDAMFDFQAVLRDGGRRLIGRNDWRECGLIDLTIPGAEPAAQIVRPTPPRPVLDWGDPTACVTLIEWAAPAAAEIDGTSFWTGVSASTAREVGVGLFVDERFVPFFGQPFDAFSEEEKLHVYELSRYCERLTAFVTSMRHSGASLFVSEFFWADYPELALTVPRVRLLQARLVREMAELEGRTVGEDDIEVLISEQEQIEERYRGLWRSDLAAVQKLLDSKIEAARGELAARLEANILSLPDDRSAFQHEKDIQANIRRLGDGMVNEQSRLTGLLAGQLAGAADAILLTLAGELSDLDPTLVSLWDLTAEVNAIWPEVEPHLAPVGPGLQAIQDLTGSMAQAAYPEFEARANRLMGQARDFAEREMLYRDVVALHQRTLPFAEELTGGFEAYTALVGRLAPVPTLEDLVEEDGSPTSLGLKLALTDFIGTWYDTLSAIPPYSLVFMTQTIRVASVSKRGCLEAEQGGYWCEYGLRVEGDFPFLGLLSRIPYEARFEFDGRSWWVVETPNQ